MTATFESDKLFEGPLKAVAKILGALTNEQLIPINLDPSLVASVAGAVARKVEPFRPEIVLQLPLFNLAFLDNLPSLSAALSQAHALCENDIEARDHLPEMIAKASELNAMFRLDIASLISHKVVTAAAPPASASTSYRNTADELHRNALFLRTHWKEIEGKVPVTPADIDQAIKLTADIIRILGDRSTPDSSVSSESADLQQRAFTGTVIAYNQLRRAMQYIRYEEQDADLIIPSLYAVGRSHKAGSSETDQAVAPPQTPHAAAVAVEPETVPGGPGGNPFTE